MAVDSGNVDLSSDRRLDFVGAHRGQIRGELRRIDGHRLKITVAQTQDDHSTPSVGQRRHRLADRTGQPACAGLDLDTFEVGPSSTEQSNNGIHLGLQLNDHRRSRQSKTDSSAQSTFIIGQLSTTYHQVRRLDEVAFGSDSRRKPRSVASSARGQDYWCAATSADLPPPIEAEGDSVRGRPVRGGDADVGDRDGERSPHRLVAAHPRDGRHPLFQPVLARLQLVAAHPRDGRHPRAGSAQSVSRDPGPKPRTPTRANPSTTNQLQVTPTTRRQASGEPASSSKRQRHHCANRNYEHVRR